MTKIKTIPSAEVFLINKLNETQPNDNKPPTPKQVEEWLIEFAKMHVKEALEITSKKFKNPDNIRYILKTYKLEEIE